MDEFLKMVEEFQCPGCVCGGDTGCGKFNVEPGERACSGHVLGTSIGVGNSFALGLPKGFCKPGWNFENGRIKGSRNTIDIRLWVSVDECNPENQWDHLNVPVWALEQGGYLFVRTYAPRINMAWVDVIKGGTLGLVPDAIDVSTFIDEID